MNELIAENEIIKKGKTYILKNDVRYGDFKKEYPSANKITGMSDKEIGKIVASENKKEIWFFSDEFFKNNYEYKAILDEEKPEKLFLEKTLNAIRKNMDLILEEITDNSERADNHKKNYDYCIKKEKEHNENYSNQQVLYLLIKEKLEKM